MLFQLEYSVDVAVTSRFQYLLDSTFYSTEGGGGGVKTEGLVNEHVLASKAISPRRRAPTLLIAVGCVGDWWKFRGRERKRLVDGNPPVVGDFLSSLHT